MDVCSCLDIANPRDVKTRLKQDTVVSIDGVDSLGRKQKLNFINENSNFEIFNNSDFGSVRVLEINGEPFFVGKDIADILGYVNATKAVLMHTDEEDRKTLTSQNGNLENIPNRGLTIINESGLYSLIFGSKLPQAKKFKRWVTSEVLPTIRKHGGYLKFITNSINLLYKKSLNCGIIKI